VTPWILGWTIHIHIVMILQNLFIMLCLFSESDQLEITTHFLCELTYMSHLLVINQLYFSNFFSLICLCKQSTHMMGLASTLASMLECMHVGKLNTGA